jgi:hypothetical protein
MKTSLLFLLTVISLASAFSQSEFIANATRDSTQRDPQIERDAAGNFVAVWNAEDFAGAGSHGDIVLQFFTSDGSPIGAEVLVNTATMGDQEKPAVAMNEAGDCVVAWASITDADSSYDIKARLFRNRLPLGPEFIVNTTRRLTQTEPDVAVDSAGNVVVVWDTWTDVNDREVMARMFMPDGTPRTAEFMVNTTVAYSQAKPAVKFFLNGSFVVVWESWKQDSGTPAGYGVYGRRYGANGSPLCGEFAVNTTVADYQWYADVETFVDGSFVVVWCSWEQDGDDGGIVLQKFGADGAPVGGEVIVNSTTAFYQWLPRIRKFPDGAFAVIWASWKQDGSREGIYLQLFDNAARRLSFETQVNTTTESFQWEPDLIISGAREVTAVWSSWGQAGKDYEIVVRRIVPVRPVGVVNPATYNHLTGRTTTQLVVHVVDSTAVTGHTYEAVFDTAANITRAFLSIRNTVTGDSVVRRFPIDRGEGVFYLTPSFQGVAVQVIPEFTLDLDFQKSFFINHSGTNLTFALNYPTAGTKKVAPVDIALIWGVTDTLANGNYVAPVDSAVSAAGGAKVSLPFTAWNVTDSSRVEMVVVENRADKRWNPGEKIIFLTPLQYRTSPNNTHGEIRPIAPAGPVTLPAPGDTNMFLTTRPIQPGERFTFATTRSLILEVSSQPGLPAVFALSQNYPNPFNPVTTIGYRVPGVGKSRVRLAVYDLLGREVATLVDGLQEAGSYRVRFDGTMCASGVYFARLEWEGRAVVQKMMLLR